VNGQLMNYQNYRRL